jgi:hypothetical protein
MGTKLARIRKRALPALCSAPVSLATRHSQLSEKLPRVDGETCCFETIAVVHAQ